MAKAPTERIRFSKTARDCLLKLKRTTQIEHWNILCRWVLCRSLAEPTPPSPAPIPGDSNLEMDWRTLGGEMADILLLALRQRCRQDGLSLDPETLAQQLRLHLHRGVGYLAAEVKDLGDLLALEKTGFTDTDPWLLTQRALVSDRDG
ncbi:MAG: DNA sulfur modification protein DndE [Cyanobacteriota bacterium]|jgi:DNA sulfur modification protein DndE